MWEWRVFCDDPAGIKPLEDLVKIKDDQSGKKVTFLQALEKNVLSERADEYLDLGLDGIGIKLRGEEGGKNARFEIKIRTHKISNYEFWTKVISSEFPLTAEQSEVVSGIALPILSKAKLDYKDFASQTSSYGHSLVKAVKRRAQAEIAGVTLEVAQIRISEKTTYSICLESEQLEVLLLIGRDIGLFSESDTAITHDLPMGLMMGYPKAIRLYSS